MIQIQHVSKLYQSFKAVDDISFTVNQGETMVLLGTSGCGKTTTLRMINRLTDPSSGTILIDGKNIMDEQAEVLRRKIGYVLQHTGLFPHYTVAENIATVPRLLQWPSGKIKDRIHSLLQKLRLDKSVANMYPHQLSGGQQQRVGLARALAADPPVLLMDEPFGALDPITRVSIREEFKQLDELKKKTIVLVTHDVQEAFDLGDKICLMNEGKIIQQGKPAELLFRPAEKFVTSFLHDQHFLLAMQTITLSDIWNELHDNGKTYATKEINISQSLWHTLQTLSESPNSSEHFFTQKNGEIKILYPATIMNAYQQYKTLKVHE